MEKPMRCNVQVPARSRPGRRVLPGLFLIAGLALGGGSAGAEPASKVESLGWLSGSWVRQEGEKRYEEHWMRPDGGVMLGMARTVRPGKAAGFEHLRIGMVDGQLAYWAMPSGQNPAAFPLVEASEGRAVFANPAHDFPQRIIYERKGDQLTAAIEGPGEQGKTQRLEWQWSRASAVDAR